ncbi:MAG TPA: cytochrome P450 [Myxococcota bacterium]|nr:cytochrome P450 [Myxococcota bacterium]
MSSLELDRIDITDPELYCGERGFPWREWDLLRREAPVYWYDRPGFAPFWAITRHADVLEISKHSEVFVNSSRLRLASLEDDARMQHSVRRRNERMGWDPDEPLDLVFMDDPKHRRLRLLTASAFTPAALRRMERELDSMAREFAREFAAQLEREGACDFVEAFAVKLPLATIGHMMDLPPGDWMRLKVLTNVTLGAHEPSFLREGEPLVRARERASRELVDYMLELTARRRSEGARGDDLTATLLRAQLDGAPLSEQQLIGYLVLLLGAGNETTRNAISGGVQALLEHPEQRDRLCANPGLVHAASEEILRWTSPVVQFARTAVEDFELRGVTIRAGQDVGMFYPSANRDEEVFPEPYQFDVARRPNNHLAFGGYGAHFCLGANLARWELRAALRALLPVLPRMRLGGRETRVPFLHVPAIQHLPVQRAA